MHSKAKPCGHIMHVSPARGPLSLPVPKACFSFPCGRVCFAITLHSGQSSWLVVLIALPLVWMNFWEALPSARPTYYRGSTEEQSGVLVILVPRKTTERLGSRENIDAWIKKFCERVDPEKRLIIKISASFVRGPRAILRSPFDSFPSEPIPPSYTLCLTPLSGVNQITGSECTVRKKKKSAVQISGFKRN